jgi:hypothetical protein
MTVQCLLYLITGSKLVSSLPSGDSASSATEGCLKQENWMVCEIYIEREF